MGVHRDATVEAFREHAGIKPIEGEKREQLDSIQQKCLELIQTVELEKSGIRDGDGLWTAGDPVAGIVEEISAIVTSYLSRPPAELPEWLGGKPGRDF